MNLETQSRKQKRATDNISLKSRQSTDLCRDKKPNGRTDGRTESRARAQQSIKRRFLMDFNSPISAVYLRIPFICLYSRALRICSRREKRGKKGRGKKREREEEEKGKKAARDRSSRAHRSPRGEGFARPLKIKRRIKISAKDDRKPQLRSRLPSGGDR